MFTIFGRDSCGYCRLSEQLLDSCHMPYCYIDVQKQNISSEDLFKAVGHTVKTVPQIFHGEDYIGGYTDLRPYVEKMSLNN